MGSGVSTLCWCYGRNQTCHNDVVFTATEPLDETLGHSFCYVRSSARFLSPTHSDRFLSPSASLRFSPTHEPRTRPESHETGFKAISGASVSANSSLPTTVIHFDEDNLDCVGATTKGNIVNGFESTASFSALPLQPVPRGGEPFQVSGFFLSGPIEANAVSGPLPAAEGGGGGEVPFSAPLSGLYGKKNRKKKVISGFRKAFNRNALEMKRPWVVPVPEKKEAAAAEARGGEGNVQWALGKAGEDRVHVVVSEEQGWLYVGIYDGFNGPDAPEFLMGHLYRAVHSELQGLFWELEDEQPLPQESNPVVEGTESKRRKLWELLAEDGLDLSGSDRFAFSVDDALSVNNANAGSAVSRRWLLLSKLKQGLSKQKEGEWRRWNLGNEEKEKEKPSGRKRKVGPVDHGLVLSALSRALQVSEDAYLDMTDKLLDTNPELALMGSCLLVVLMRDEDVYVMNVGDSRAIVAHYEPKDVDSSVESGSKGAVESGAESIVEESLGLGQNANAQQMRLVALQLSTDHSTSIEEVSFRFGNMQY